MEPAEARRERQVRDLRFLETLRAVLAGCGSEAALYRSAVHRVAAHCVGAAVALAVYDPVAGTVSILQSAGGRVAWPDALLCRAAEEGHSSETDGVLALPLLAGESVWGVLAVRREASSGEQHAFDAAERTTFRAAADLLAAEIERRRLTLLDDTLDALLRKTKPIDVYNHALRELRRFVPYDHSASIMTLPRGTAQVTVRAEKVVGQRGQHETLLDSPRRGRTLRLTVPQARYLETPTEPIRMQRGEDRYVLQPAHPDGAGLWRVLSLRDSRPEGAIVGIPLVFGGQTLGLLRLAAHRPEALSALLAQRRTIERFGRLLAVTLYRSELYYQSDRQLQAIKRISRIITESRPVEEVAEQVLDLALQVLHVQVGALGLLDGGEDLNLVAQTGCSEERVPVLRIGQGIAGEVVAEGRSRAVPDVTTDPAYVVFNARTRSELAVPIMYDGAAIGFLAVESFEDGRFREEDEEVISFLEALANQAAIAIKAAQRRLSAGQQIEDAAAADPAGIRDGLVAELRAANQHLAAANEAQSEFLARMSHDLRGPLSVIVGLANLLSEESPAMSAEQQRESLAMIRASGEVLSSLIGTILDLSALEAGRVPLDRAPLPAAGIFGYLETVARRQAEVSARELHIHFNLDEAIGNIDVDEEKFLRILLNLIANAVKFTPAGGAVTVSARAEDDNLHVEVADTGIGIPEAERERVFQPFVRLSTGQQGTGLGLAVVRRLVELHGGRVWVEAAATNGAAFHVVLPAALVSAPAPGPESDRAESLASARSPAGMTPRDPRLRGTILVVEDTPAEMDVMRLAVTSRGYGMHGVGTGEEALAWLEENRPHVVLLDMNLPGIDGYTVAGRIKGRIETHTIPVVAVTAEALAADEERARASGCDAYLTKPIDIGRLLATIDAVTV